MGGLQNAVLDCMLSWFKKKIQRMGWETDNPHYGEFILMVNVTINSEETHLWACVKRVF